MMLAGYRLTSHLRTLSVFVVHLLITDICKGQLIGASQPIIAAVGDDVTLPCRLEPAEDLTEMTLEWSRPDLIPRFVYVWRSGVELKDKKHKTFQGRTTLFTEGLRHGNISLRLNRVKPSDNGTYSCYIPTLEKQTNIHLDVGAASPPVISLSGIDGYTGRVVLHCESAGWYPEPEVLWLDGDGNLLSAGPTETVRGPDDLYTVSSRVNVEKKHGNKFTCRVQHKNINQSREDLIHVPDDFFIIPYSSAVPIIVGLSVSLAFCILFILASGLFLWRGNRTKSKRTLDKTEKEEEKNCSETEAETLMYHEVVQMKDGKKLDGSKSEDVDHQIESRQQKNSSSNQHNFFRDIILGDIDLHCKSVRLKNTSTEEKLLGGCKLQLQINNGGILTYTFDQSFKVKAGGKITLYRPCCGTEHAPDGDLVWRDLKPWNPKDQLQFVLSKTGETKVLSLSDLPAFINRPRHQTAT